MPPKYRSVERDVVEFCGWDQLMGLVKRAEKMEFKAYRKGIVSALIAALFETGGRVSEVLELKPENFNFTPSEEFVIVRMSVKKRKKGTTTPTTRTFPIKKTDSLWPILENWIHGTEHGKRLFPFSRSKAFLMIRSLGKDLYPHWFRAQRASQLAFEYGWDAGKLSEFYAWKHFPTALRYARLGWKGLAESMR